MQLYELKTNHYNKGKKRIGRGGKRGTTSGRGQKGQKSRAGHKIKPGYQELILRLPKFRGYKNKPIKSKPIVLNLKDLENIESRLDFDTLKKAKILPKKYFGEVKILGKGEAKAWQVRGLKVSKSAKIKIEKAGGGIG